jgi:hypothetical protein
MEVVSLFTRHKNNGKNIRIEVFTAVTMKNAVFWDVAMCRSCVNRCSSDIPEDGILQWEK